MEAAAAQMRNMQEENMEKRQVFEAKVEELDNVLSFIGEVAEESGCSPKIQTQMEIATEELFVNIAHYAYGEQTGKAWITAKVSEESDIISVVFEDEGAPYNPLEKEDPDITQSAEDRMIGGLGIYMVKKSMDNMEYRWENGRNFLTITKRIT